MVREIRKVRWFCLLITLMVLAAACSGGEEETAEHTASHWSYEGDSGPEHWSMLSEDYAVCGTGHEQSPIDVAAAAPEDLANIAFNYRPSNVNILNNGHTVQVNYDAGSTIELDGTTYNLLQFHLHAPSEHTVDGRSFPAELHLVHQNADGGLAVVGVLIEEGAENNNFASVWANLPAEEQAVETIGGATVAADSLLPADRLSYRYDGSLTTPPCSEGVEWLLLTTPIEMSAAQIRAFVDIVEDNHRPVQPLHDRELVEDTSAN